MLILWAVVFVVFASGVSGAEPVSIDAVNFPDSVFREYVSSSIDINPHDGRLTDDDISYFASRQSTLNLNNKGIASLKGIEYLSNKGLSLQCANNHLVALDLSGNAFNITSNTALANQTKAIASLDRNKNNEYQYSINLKDYDASFDIENVSGISFTSYYDISYIGSNYVSTDSSGKILFRFKPKKFTYSYNTKAAGNPNMGNITITFSDDTRPDEVSITPANFPDAVFRSLILSNTINKHSDEVLDEDEIAATSITINTGAASLKGIELFTALTSLTCTNTNLTSLDLSRNTKLTELVCSNNRNLASLYISENTELEQLTLSNNNSLRTLDVSRNTKLTELNCTGNQLSDIDVSRNTNLQTLNCNNNALNKLNVSSNTALTSLQCSNNHLMALDLSSNNLTGTSAGAFDTQSVNFIIRRISDRYVLNLNEYLDYIGSTDFIYRVSGFTSSDCTADMIYFDNKPAGFTYAYNTSAGRSNLTYMRGISATFTEEASDPSNTVTNPAGRPVLPSGLLRSIASAFGAGSNIYALAASEIVSSTGRLEDRDKNEILRRGETAVKILPVMKPAYTGIYVVSCDLSDTEANQIRFLGITAGTVGEANAVNVKDINYKFFDGENFAEITSIPSHKKIYVAMNLTAEEEISGVVTVPYTAIQAITSTTEKETLRINIAESLNISPSDIIFLREDQISPVAPARLSRMGASLVSAAERVSDGEDTDAEYELISGLGTIHDLDVPDGNDQYHYVFSVKLPDEVPSSADIVSISRDVDFRIYFEDATQYVNSEYNSVMASFGFGFGIINTWEILTMSGEKVEPQNLGIREFLMVGLLRNSTPLTIFLANLIPGVGQVLSAIAAVLGGGCNLSSGFAAGLLVMALILFRNRH